MSLVDSHRMNSAMVYVYFKYLYSLGIFNNCGAVLAIRQATAAGHVNERYLEHAEAIITSILAQVDDLSDATFGNLCQIIIDTSSHQPTFIQPENI